MDGRHSPFQAAFPLGTWFSTRVRLSVWFPVIAIVFCVNLKSLQLGLTVTLLLLVSVVIHEFFHVFAARSTGGSADEILIWPAGGLAFTRPAGGFRSEFWTSAAGPFSNLLLCVLTFPVVYRAGIPPGTWHPFVLAAVELKQTLGQDLLVLLFDVNWVLLLVNLLPVYPLDGGQMLRALIALKTDSETARFASLRIGMGLGIVGAILGLVFSQIWLVFIGFFVLCMGMYEFFVIQLSDQLDDSFLGYDFSQGYTSLERSETRSPPRRPGPIQRWRQRRAEEKRQRDEQERIETERRVDELLDKVHREGINSLSDAEKRFLQRASGRYRSPDRPS
jgi:Zn-dependent protease